MLQEKYLFERSELPLLEVDIMDDEHLEDIELINTLYRAVILCYSDSSANNKNRVAKHLTNWRKHIEKHFAQEEIRMQKEDFPGFHLHIREHYRFLELLDNISNHWSNNQDISHLRHYLESYAKHWLMTHIQTLDTRTAHFFKKNK